MKMPIKETQHCEKPLNKHRRAYSQQEDAAIVSETEDVLSLSLPSPSFPGVSFLFLQVRFKQKVETSKLW